MALSREQVRVARHIINTGRRLGAPRHVIRVALGAALTEANLLNPHYGDADSVGPFQERASQGWGTPRQLRSVVYQAEQFYKRAIPLFHQGTRGGALAQAVARSAFPGHYGPNVRAAGSILRHFRDSVAQPERARAQQQKPQISRQTTTSQALTRRPIAAVSLPTPLAPNLPLAGPRFPQGGIGTQLGGTVASNQTLTGQRRAGSQATIPSSNTPGQLTVTKTTTTTKTTPPPPAPKQPRQKIPIGTGPVRQALHAAKEIAGRPYVWGGGHGSFHSRGYDCSGAVSYVLHKLGVLDHPLTSGAMGSVLKPGPGAITVFYNAGHTFMRFQTKHGFIYWGTSVGDSGAGGLGRHPAPSQSYLSQYKVGHVASAGGLEASARALGQLEHDQKQQTQQQPQTSVKVTKGIHTETPRFSSVPILADFSARQPASGTLTESQRPHVPLSVRKIGAKGRRRRPRGRAPVSTAGMLGVPGGS